MRYRVIVPLVQVATTAGGAGIQVVHGGLLPAETTSEALDNLIELGYVEVDEEPEPEDQGSDKVADVLDAVGDDKAKAAEALEAEKAGKNRPTLLSKLQAVIDA